MAEHARATERELSEPATDAHDPADDEPTHQAGPTHRADDTAKARAWERFSGLRGAAAIGVGAVIALSAVAAWLGYHDIENRNAARQHSAWIDAARQGAVNLTTIDYTNVDAAIKKILDCSTGTFREDFQKRSQPFIDVVKQAQSKTTGTVTSAAVESSTADHARVLVTVAVKTSSAGTPEQDPRAWRMRMDVEKSGTGVAVSNVEFVP